MDIANDIFEKHYKIRTAIENECIGEDYIFHRDKNKKSFRYGINLPFTRSIIASNIMLVYNIIYIISIFGLDVNSKVVVICQIILLVIFGYMHFKLYQHLKYKKLMDELGNLI